MSERKEGRGASEEDPRTLELVRLLDQAAAEERAVVAEAEALDQAPGLSRVAEILEREWRLDEPGPSRRSRKRRVPPLLIALASIAALALIRLSLLSSDRADGPAEELQTPSETLLDSRDFELLPAERGEDGRLILRWGGPDDALYNVTILDAASGDPLQEVGPIMARTCSLDPDSTRTWPARLFVTVWMTAPDGTRSPTSGPVDR